MLTVEDYINQHGDIATCDPQIEVNAATLLQRANALMQAYTAATGNEAGALRSGWRPPAVNACTPGASATSKHMTGEAVDIADNNQAINEWVMTEQGTQALIECELWHEHPRDTPSWCHVQSAPPHSGNRHFYAK